MMFTKAVLRRQQSEFVETSALARVPRLVKRTTTRRPRTALRTENKVEITFIAKDGTKKITKEDGKIVRNVALEQKLELYEGFSKVMNCGGNGQCGTCAVIVNDDADLCLSAVTDAERKKLGAERLGLGWRLACQMELVKSDGSVEIQLNPKK